MSKNRRPPLKFYEKQDILIRTADIEQQLNLGVHGPREVHVILV